LSITEFIERIEFVGQKLRLYLWRYSKQYSCFVHLVAWW